MPKDIGARILRAVLAGPDMRKPQGESGYVLPIEGPTLARFIGYFEVGKHGVPRGEAAVYEPRARLVFELVDWRNTPRNVDGLLVPPVVTVEASLSLRAGDCFFHTFERMNLDGAASHMVQLLDDIFIVHIVHRDYGSRSGRYATIERLGGYLIFPARLRSESSADDMLPFHYGPKAFVWEAADLDDWQDIYIPGHNFIQERIKQAENWPEHPLAAVVACK